MQLLRPFSFAVFLLVMLCSFSALNLNRAMERRRFTIEAGSRLYIKGSSNVNTFTCDCQDQFPGQVLEVERNGGHARFRNVTLLLETKKFDCHNRKIDQDMQKAMKAAQYPHIAVTLNETWQDPKYLNGNHQDWFEVKAKVNIKIAGVSQTQSVTAIAKILGNNRVQLKGESNLQMSSYGISPPEAMFGMIKVNDWISFHFDLVVTVEELL